MDALVETVLPAPPEQLPKSTEPGDTVTERIVGTTFRCAVTLPLPPNAGGFWPLPFPLGSDTDAAAVPVAGEFECRPKANSASSTTPMTIRALRLMVPSRAIHAVADRSP